MASDRNRLFLPLVGAQTIVVLGASFESDCHFNSPSRSRVRNYEMGPTYIQRTTALKLMSAKCVPYFTCRGKRSALGLRQHPVSARHPVQSRYSLVSRSLPGLSCTSITSPALRASNAEASPLQNEQLRTCGFEPVDDLPPHSLDVPFGEPSDASELEARRSTRHRNFEARGVTFDWAVAEPTVGALAQQGCSSESGRAWRPFAFRLFEHLIVRCRALFLRRTVLA